MIQPFNEAHVEIKVKACFFFIKRLLHFLVGKVKAMKGRTTTLFLHQLE
jgi:hypothetical protein